jgi:predicted nucleic acid-binding protein
VLAVFDATVLCGALRKPTGYNFKLLELAADGTLLQGFTTDIAGMEFVRNALDGLGGVSYEMELIEAFLDHFAPLFNPDNIEPSPIGRALPVQTSLHNRPIGEIVYELTGRTRDDLLDGLSQQLRLLAGEFDAYDIHLVAAAVACNADVICSANRSHLPEGPLAGHLQVIGPGRLAVDLGIT